DRPGRKTGGSPAWAAAGRPVPPASRQITRSRSPPRRIRPKARRPARPPTSPCTIALRPLTRTPSSPGGFPGEDGFSCPAPARPGAGSSWVRLPCSGPDLGSGAELLQPPGVGQEERHQVHRPDPAQLAPGAGPLAEPLAVVLPAAPLGGDQEGHGM